MVLGDFEKTKGNNFTLIRLIFAWAVLFGHAFPITGNGSDPLTMLILPYQWIGGYAVGGFFAISGYLITASFAQRGAKAFVLSRALRLYPAVIVYCALTVLVIGPLSSPVPVSQYFDANAVGFFHNASIWNWDFNLPYVFQNHPFPGATNGSSWTLPVELRCYVMVFVLGFFGVFEKPLRSAVAFFALLLITGMHYGWLPLFGNNLQAMAPLYCFLWGGLFWSIRKWLPMSWIGVIVGIASLFYAAKHNLYGYFDPPIVAYITYMLAYRTPHLDLDKWGDISYGVYIYAWTIQQAVWWQGQSAWMNALVATIIVVPISYLSWRFVESPALSLRKKLSFARAKQIAATDQARLAS